MSAPTHVVVLVHGLLDASYTMASLAAALSTALVREEPAAPGGVAPASYLFYQSAANGFLKTLDGIEAGARRLGDEIRGLVASHPSLTELSLVGVSLGGVYCRAVLPLIADSDDVPLRRRNFITLASPHVGVRGHQSGAVEAALRWGLLGRTGAELVLADSARVMERLGSPEALALLAAFPNRVLVANLVGDDKVPYHSAALALSTSTLPAVATAQPALLKVRYDASTRTPEGTTTHTMPRLTAPPNAVAAAADEHEVIDMTPYPHIRRVFQQTVTAGSGAASNSFTQTTGHSGVAAASMPAADNVIGELEASLIASLRAMGGWTNVDVLFTEWGGAVLNHDRISGAHPVLAPGGADVLAFVAKHAFIP